MDNVGAFSEYLNVKVTLLYFQSKDPMNSEFMYSLTVITDCRCYNAISFVA